MSVRLGVTGATGRMGREVLGAAGERDDCEVVLAVSRSADAGPVAGRDLDPAAAFDSLVTEREPNAIVDFTAPGATREYAAACAEAGVPLVTGTTGLDEDDRAALEAAAESTAVLHAPNFARGVRAVANVVGDLVRSLPGYDVELVETHHGGKRDAPSGTATRLLSEIESAGEFGERTHGREGEAPREDGEIGVHSIRAGSITGEHEVVLAGDGEEVRLSHRVEDRRVFATGAVDAAVWLAGRDPGRYEFAEVIEG